MLGEIEDLLSKLQAGSCGLGDQKLEEEMRGRTTPPPTRLLLDFVMLQPHNNKLLLTLLSDDICMLN
jgi:hypothetical protein